MKTQGHYIINQAITLGISITTRVCVLMGGADISIILITESQIWYVYVKLLSIYGYILVCITCD